jgi:undecaprenyl-diphosphatase
MGASRRVEQLPARHAIALGALQGPTELLPVSSSGHLVVVPNLLGWRYAELDPELRKSFEVALHAGTAAALLIGLRAEVAEYLHEFGPRNLVTLGLSFAPAAIVAYRYERVIERRLSEPLPVALGLIVGSIGMALADGRPQQRTREQTSLRDAVVIGLAQACALAPGISRNGATLTAARLLGFRRRDANIISRQIALPVIVGAAVLKGIRLATRRDLPPGTAYGMGAGAAAAFGSTLVSMRLIAMLERSRSLLPYAGYRTLLAGIVLARLRRRRSRAARIPGFRAAEPRAPLAAAVE